MQRNAQGTARKKPTAVFAEDSDLSSLPILDTGATGKSVYGDIETDGVHHSSVDNLDPPFPAALFFLGAKPHQFHMEWSK